MYLHLPGMARERTTNTAPGEDMHFHKAVKAVLVIVADREGAGRRETVFKARCSGHSLIPISGYRGGFPRVRNLTKH